MGIIPILWAGDILVKSKNALKTLKPRINLKKGEGALGNYSERVYLRYFSLPVLIFW